MTPPHPATGDAVSAPSESGAPATKPRYHDLDALRAFAMLAGIAFHAAVPFIPYWTPNGPGAQLLGGIFVGIHGFRMPLFFLLSGFFTTMLWQRAGTRGLLRHRLKRVGLPLALAIVVILPLVTLGLLGGMALAGNPAVEPDPTPQPAFRLAHLWFLWMLLLLVGAFAVVVTLARRLPSPDSRIHRVLSSRPGWAAVLLVIAVLAQSRMTNGLVGPDTSRSRRFSISRMPSSSPALCLGWRTASSPETTQRSDGSRTRPTGCTSPTSPSSSWPRGWRCGGTSTRWSPSR